MAEDAKEAVDAGKVSKRAGKSRAKRAGRGKEKEVKDNLLPPDSIATPRLLEAGGYVSSVLKEAAPLVQVLTKRETTYFAVDIQAAVRFFLVVARFVVALERRAPWPSPWKYVAVWLRAFLERLQRVGVATDQCMPNNDQLITDQCQVPTVVAAYINQYGRFTEMGTNVEVSPLITLELQNYIIRLSVVYWDPGHAGYATATAGNADNLNDWMEHCYGRVTYLNYVFGTTMRFVNTGFTPMNTVALILMSFTNALEIYRSLTAAVVLTAGQRANLITVAANPYDVAFAVTQPLAAAPPPAGIPAFLHGYFLQVHAQFVSAADCFGGVAAPGNPLQASRNFPDYSWREMETMELRARLTLGTVSLHPDGSRSTVVRAVDPNGSTSATSTFRGLTANEYLFGVIMNQQVVLMTRSAIPFNFASIDQSTDRYSIAPFGYNAEEMRMRAIRECVQRRRG